VNFDAGIRFSGLKRMNMASGAVTDPINVMTRQMADSKIGEFTDGEEATVSTGHVDESANLESKASWFRTERAMWMDISQGFKFEYAIDV